MNSFKHREGNHLSAFNKALLAVWKAVTKTSLLNRQAQLIMKLTLGLVFICMQISAAGLAQTITLSEKKALLEDLFEEINRQTGYEFVYDYALIAEANPVDISVKDATLEQVLTICFAKQPLMYTISQRIIVVKKQEVSETIPSVENLRTTITGTITDKAGAPMPGVSIIIKGTNIGTTSDAVGKYSITLPEGEGWGEADVIVFTFIGYKKVEEPVKARILIDVTMEEEVIGLGEVVINAGYYNVTDREKTGSISRISSKEIGRQPITNPLQALQGRVPGIYIEQFSGVPGSNFQVQIRGINSLANGNDPLYIIDGVPFISETMSSEFTAGGLYQGGISPMNSINPNDIESIEVLKDADATAIYGSRGANGVILITTKKGKAGKVRVGFNVKSGASKMIRRMDLLNTQQYIDMRMEAVENDGDGIKSGEYDINGTWDQNRYTDWQEVLFGGIAKTTDLNASISGGSNETQFLFGVSYNIQGTAFPGDNKADRFSTHFSVSHTSPNRKFNTILSSSYSLNSSDIVSVDMTQQALELAPNAPALYDAQGELNWANSTWRNPMSWINDRFLLQSYTLLTNVELGYEIVKGLRIKTSVGLSDVRNEERATALASSLDPALNLTPASFSFLNTLTATNRSWIIEPQANWETKIGRGRLAILIGGTYQDRLSESNGLTFSGFPSDALVEDPKSAADVNLGNYNYAEYRYAALYGRVNYTWDEKYILNITGRRDASSRFGPGKKVANFGAFGLAWIFSNETFIKNTIPFLSFGKIRGSYGLTGNDQIGDYQYLDSYGANGQYQVKTLSPTRVFNPDYGWEVNKKLETAIELGFLNDRILLTTAYYWNRSSNQLIQYQLAATTGNVSVLKNFPATVQNTGLEIELSSVNVRTGFFKWNSAVNVTFPRNKLVDFPNLESSSYADTYIIGRPLNIYKVYHYLGVDPTTGIYQFQDVNGDGEVTQEDRQSAIEYGQEYYGGLNNSLSYKGLQLDIFFQFVNNTGTLYAPYVAPGFFTSGFGANQPAFVLKDRWQNPGEDATRQVLSRKQTVSNAQAMYSGSDANVGDIFFVRLKNVSISWQLPDKLLKGIRSRIYIQGQNLLTFTNYTGLDPETARGYRLPPLTTFVGGLELTF